MAISRRIPGIRTVAGTGAVLLMLAGCSTPQERCVRDVNRELETVTRLIDETERNLARGYTYVSEVQNVRVGVTGCVGGGGYWGGGLRFCGSTEPRAVSRAVPIDPEVEQRKLDGLLTRQRALSDLSARARDVCRDRFPA